MENPNKDSNSFNMLLKGKAGAADVGGCFNLETLPLDRDKLLQLVQMIRIQMNYHLFEALSESNNDGMINGDPFPLMDLYEINPLPESLLSKTRRPFEETVIAGLRHDIDDIIERASKRYGVEPELIRSVIRAESDFDVYATSHKGAMGLMQLMPETAKDMGVKNPYDPVENIMGGTRFLKSLMDRYDDNIPLALAAYNWGPGNLERNPDRLPRETRTYIARVNNYYREEQS